MQRQAGLASVHQAGHGVDGHVRHAADRPHGRALAEHREDLDALGEGQLVHAAIKCANMPIVKHYRSLPLTKIGGPVLAGLTL